LISWIANEGLAGDKDAAEWVLLNIIGKVYVGFFFFEPKEYSLIRSSQSRTPPVLPPSLTITRFPAPTTQSSMPSLYTVLSHLLPIVVTLPLSLEVLNTSPFSPESKNEDLHSGRLQLPRGTTCVVTEGGITEGGVFDRGGLSFVFSGYADLIGQGVMNLRALQEMMAGQTLEYVFPFSRFAFQTDVAFLILSEGRKSTFFQVP
jgi:hypothetical protein